MGASESRQETRVYADPIGGLAVDIAIEISAHAGDGRGSRLGIGLRRARPRLAGVCYRLVGL